MLRQRSWARNEFQWVPRREIPGPQRSPPARSRGPSQLSAGRRQRQLRPRVPRQALAHVLERSVASLLTLGVKARLTIHTLTKLRGRRDLATATPR